MPIRWLAVFTLMLLAASVARAEKPIAPKSIPGSIIVTAEQTIELTVAKPTLLIIDARRPEEYQKGHIEGAVNLPDTDLSELGLARYTRGHERPLLFYCNGERCLRSANAIRKVLSWGYQTVYWFRGGWAEWLDKGLPITRG